MNHVLDTPRCPNNNLRSSLKSGHIITDTGASNAGMAVNGHKITNGDNDFLDLLGQLAGGCKDQCLACLEIGIKFLEYRDGEGSGLSGSRLRLGNDIGTCKERSAP